MLTIVYRKFRLLFSELIGTDVSEEENITDGNSVRENVFTKIHEIQRIFINGNSVDMSKLYN